MRDQPFGLKDMFFSQRIMQDFAKNQLFHAKTKEEKRLIPHRGKHALRQYRGFVQQVFMRN